MPGSSRRHGVVRRVALASRRRVVLDLGGVFFVAREGLDLIRGFPADQVTLERCSPFLAEQLQASER